MRSGRLEAVFIAGLLLTGLGVSSPFVASKIKAGAFNQQVFEKQTFELSASKQQRRNIANTQTADWFSALVIDLNRPYLGKDFKYEKINGQETIMAPWVEGEETTYFLRALLLEEEDPFVQLYTIHKSKNWLFLSKGLRRGEGEGNASLDITLIERQFICHESEDEKCCVEHVGIDFKDFESFRREASMEGMYRLAPISRSTTMVRSIIIRKEVPRSYFREFVQAVEAHPLFADKEDST